MKDNTIEEMEKFDMLKTNNDLFETKSNAQKTKFYYFIGIIGIGVLIITGLLNIIVFNNSSGVFEFFGAVIVFILLMSIKITGSTRLASIVGIILMSSFSLYNFITGGIQGNGLLWLYIYPSVAYFLTNKKFGTYLIIGMFASMFSLYLADGLGLIILPYDASKLQIFLIAMVVTSFFVYYYQSIQENIQLQLSKQLLIVDEANERLNDIVAKNEEYQEKLKDNFSDTKSKNEELENQKLAMINLIEDLEEEKLRSDLRSETLKQFKEAVDNTQQHIIFTDTEGKILYANKAVSETTGYSNKEILGKTPSVWGGQMPKEFYSNFWSTIKEQKKPFEGEVTNKRKNGELYIAYAQIYPILDQSGNVKFFVGLERDITKEKEVDKMKSEFVSVASHQLKTPLTGIKRFIELLAQEKAGPINEEQRNIIADIQVSTQRMVELVNDLLNVSRIESGKKFNVTKAPVDICEVIEEEKKDTELNTHKKNVSIVIDPSVPDSLIIPIDRNKVRQVIHNLIDNSMKYSPKDTKITIGMAEENDEFVTIYVKDEGYGIPESEKDNVFKKFFRASNAVKLETDGTGLGLHIVREIMRAHNGDVTFETELGKGTTFFLKFPK